MDTASLEGEYAYDASVQRCNCFQISILGNTDTSTADIGQKGEYALTIIHRGMSKAKKNACRSSSPGDFRSSFFRGTSRCAAPCDVGSVVFAVH
jgi:hypothetical protein